MLDSQPFRTLLDRIATFISEVKKFISMNNEQTENSRKVYEAARAAMGSDITPEDTIPDAVGCAEAVNEIFRRALRQPVGGGASTAEMYKCLLNETRFDAIDLMLHDPLPGDVIIAVTGTGNGRLPHGHVGIVAKQGILSNSSESGKVELNYTLESWYALFHTYGGFTIHVFRVK